MPADGERRLCSAITDVPGRDSASANGRPSRPVSTSAAEIGERALALAPPHGVARGVHQLVEPRHHDDVASTQRSSTDCAAPESIARSAARTPSASVSSPPPT